MKDERINEEVVERLLGFCGISTSQYLCKPLYVKKLSESNQQAALSLHKTLLKEELVKSGRARKNDWELGWGENFSSLKIGNLDSLIPKYFGKFPFVRYSGAFYGANSDTELRFLRLILLNEIEKLLKLFPVEKIIEFGCGTGHNLFFLQSFFADLRFVGTDWSQKSSDIIQFASRRFRISNVVAAEPFDYFNPKPDFEIGANAGIITIASLEQVGSEFGQFLDFAIKARPKFSLHIEPEEQLLNSKDAFDQSSVDYIRKRGYLTGFMSELKRRENLGEIEILRIRRTQLGSFPMDGYSVFVWTPTP